MAITYLDEEQQAPQQSNTSKITYLDDLDNQSQQDILKPDYNNGYAARMADAATMGWMDELAGTSAKAVGGTWNLLRGRPFTQGFDTVDQLTQKEKQLREDYAKEHPYLAASADLIGTGVGMAAGGKVFGGKLMPENPYAQAALVSGIQGAGNADEGGLGERIIGGAKGVGVGLATTGVLNTAFSPVKTAQTIKRAFTGEGAEPSEIISKAIGGTKQKIQDAIDALKSGKNLSLLDYSPNEVVSGELHGIAQNAASKSRDVAENLSQTLKNRASQSGARIENAFNENISNVKANDFDSFIKGQQEQVKPLYNQSYGVNLQKSALENGENGFNHYVNIQDQVNTLKQDFPELLQDARKATAGMKDELGNSIKFDPSKQVYNTRDLHTILQTIRKEQNSLYQSGDAPIGENLKRIGDEISNSLKEINPSFRQAQETAGDYLQLKSAYQKGADVLTNLKEPSEGAKLWQNYDPNEQKAALAGFRNALLDKAGAGAKLATNINQILSDNGREALNNFLGKDAPKFINQLQAELDANKTFTKIAPKLYGIGSQEARGTLGNYPTDTVGRLSQVWNGVKNRISGIKAGNAPAITDILTNKDSAIPFLEKLRDAKGVYPEQVEKLIQYAKNNHIYGTTAAMLNTGSNAISNIKNQNDLQNKK